MYLLPDSILSAPTRNTFGSDELTQVQGFLARDNGFLGGALASQAESREALTFRSDTRSSVLASATGCEVLLDDLLRHLLWESGRRPEDCVGIFVKDSSVTTTLKRAQSHTQTLLKGNWDVMAPGEVRSWQEDVALVRHRVIHGAYVPTVAEAHAAIDSADDLHRHLGELVLTQLHKFPRTALLLFGKEELQRRDKFTRKVRNAFEEEHENPWSTRFVRWRDCLERLVDAELFPGKGQTPHGQMKLVAVVDKPRNITWVLHDTTRHVACYASIDENQLSDGQRTALWERAAGIPPEHLPVSAFIRGCAHLATPTEDWVCEHRRLPLHEVMVDGQDLY